VKILYLAHRIPFPPNKGDKIRSHQALRHLARRHDVWCACFVDDPEDLRHVSALGDICRGVIALPLHRRSAVLRGLGRLAIDEPATEGFYHDRRMQVRLRDLSRRIKFDAALFFSSSMGQYADDVRARRKVIDFCDLDSRKWAALARITRPPRSWMLAAEARFLAARELEQYERFDASILISRQEASGWPAEHGAKLFIVRNGVELPDLPRQLAYDTGIVGFVGDLRYPPNVDAVCWFAETIWPRIHAACGAAEFQIVGRGAPRRVRCLQRTRGVHVVGEVVEVLPHLARFQVAVAPLRIARGVQNKVLEAMAAARPVVCTLQAATGIDAVPGKHFIVTGQEDEMRRRVVELLTDPARCALLGARARQFVERSCSWQEPMDRLERVLAGLQDPPGAVRPADEAALITV